MQDRKIYQLIGELEKQVVMGNMALNKFAHDSSEHFNVLTLSFNSVKNLLVEKGIMTDSEINERIILEIEKAKGILEDEIIDDTDEPTEEIIEDLDEESSTEEDYEEEQEEG